MDVSSEQLERMRQRQRGTMAEMVGYEPVEASKERVVAMLPFRDSLRQLTGVFHAGAILTLADTAATQVANMNTQPHPPEFDPKQFTMTVQLNANFIRNSGTGKLVASAVPIHIGRRTVVVQTTVRDRDERLVATITTTMLRGLSE